MQNLLPQKETYCCKSRSFLEQCDGILHHLWFLLLATLLVLIQTGICLFFFMAKVSSSHVHEDSSRSDVILLLGVVVVACFGLEIVLRLVSSGLTNAQTWFGLLDTTACSALVALCLSTSVPIPLMLLRLPRLISLMQTTKKIEQLDAQLQGMAGVCSPMKTSLAESEGLATENASRPDVGLNRNRLLLDEKSSGGSGYFGSAMVQMMTDAGKYSSDIPAVRLLQLLYRSTQPGCMAYNVLEKHELRQLMVLLSRNRIYVDKNLQSANEAYFKEFHFIAPSKDSTAQKGGARRRNSVQLQRDGAAASETTHNAHPSRIPAAFQTSSWQKEKSVNLVKGFTKTPRNQLPNTNIRDPSPSSGKREAKSGIVEMITRRQFKISLQNTRLSACMQKIDDWDFDVFELEDCSLGTPLLNLCGEIFTSKRYEFVETSMIDQGKLVDFIIQIEQGYSSGQEEGAVNKYHNRVHAADVLQTVHFFLNRCNFAQVLTEIEQMALLMSAVVHDFKHPGRSNLFLCRTRAELALIYNDNSILENFHISQALTLMQDPRFNFVQYFDEPTFSLWRKVMVSLVLATDLKFHFELLGEFNTFTSEIMANSSMMILEGSQGLENTGEEDSAQLILSAMKICLKAADISHPTKVWNVHEKWTALLAEEFYLQGDEEKRLGLSVIPPYCRETTCLPESQKGFINFLVKPLFASWVKYINSEEAVTVIENLEKNISNWEQSSRESIASTTK